MNITKWRSHRGFSVFYLLIPLGFLWATTSVADCSSDNLLANPGFDSGLLTGAALNWRDNSGWADVDVDYSRIAYDGRAGKVQRIDVGAVRSGAMQFVQAGVQLLGKRSYRISIWMRGNISAPVEVLMRKQGKPYTTYMSDGFKVNKTWKKYVFQDIAPVDDGNVYFMVRSKGAGWIELDNAELVNVTDCSTFSGVSVGNQINNSSFEVGLDKWAVLTRERNYEHMAQVRWEAVPAKTIKTSTVHGKSALLLHVPRYGVTRLSSPFVVLESGEAFSLSFYAKSDKPRRIRFGVVAGDYGKHRGLIKSMKISKDWTMLNVSGMLPVSRKNVYHIFIESADEGEFLVDAIQLERGNKPTAYQQSQPVEVGFDHEGLKLLLFNGELESLPVRVYAPGIDKVKIEIWSTNWQENRVLINSQLLSLDKDGYGLLVQPIDTSQTGYQKLTANVLYKDGVSATAELAVGVVPRINNDSEANLSPFGVHARFSPSDLERVKTLGASWLRLHPPYATKWAIVEPRKGEYRYFDDSLLAAKERGFEVLGSLDATPKWASGTDETRFFRYRTRMPQDMRDWRRYVKRTVSHYKGVINYWEVWNEPDSDSFFKLADSGSLKDKAKAYTQLLQAAYDEAKKANPDSVIVAGCPTGSNPVAWIKAIAEEGALQYMDVLSFHRYTDGRPGDVLDVTTGELINKFRKIMREHGELKPVWETESGVRFIESEYDYFPDITGGYHSSATEVAAYIVRNYVHLIENGVERWFYYGAISSGRPDRTEFTGLFEWDASPRPAAVAYAVMSNLIGHAEYKKSWRAGSDVHAVRFNSNSNSEVIDIVWLNDWVIGRTVSTEIKAPGDCSLLEVSDLMGRVIQPRHEAGVAVVAASITPLYIHWSACGP